MMLFCTHFTQYATLEAYKSCTCLLSCVKLTIIIFLINLKEDSNFVRYFFLSKLGVLQATFSKYFFRHLETAAFWQQLCTVGTSVLCLHVQYILQKLN